MLYILKPFTVTLNLPKLPEPGLKPLCLEMRGKTGCDAALLQSQNQDDQNQDEASLSQSLNCYRKMGGDVMFPNKATEFILYAILWGKHFICMCIT